MGTGELENILAAAGIAPAPACAILRFASCTSRAEGDARAAQGRFSRELWDGAVRRPSELSLRRSTPLVFWPRRDTPRTSRLRKAAIIPAPSASFRNCAGSSARGVLSPWLPRPSGWPLSGVREITLIGQDTTCYGEDFDLKDGLALLLEKLAAIEVCAGCGSCMPIPTKSPDVCWKPSHRHEKICSYMDVPLQHASPTVLKRMKRGGGADVFLRSIEKMRRTIPGCNSADLVHCRVPWRDRKRI